MLWCFMDRDLNRLEDILEGTVDIANFMEGLNFELFVAERERRYSILHALAIIGEASHHVSPELQSRHENIPWRSIVGFRHRVIHGYGSLNLELVWKSAVELVPELQKQIRAVLAIEYPDAADTSVK